MLDFGCANGHSTLRLASAHPEVDFLGIDINEEMIGAAQRALEEAPLPNVRFERRDIVEMA